ncbi:[FeFe] hydrogenase H-cluster radical SAM maturase HydG [Candidatus Saganbacteria bacterium]|uniref:[FeFe] hydrogenase H-cluster radical SAM maturase HydG n=1 Tax=Candidatus Saganbacteria bacterium TaxID=2575572 RepID=A0A9D6ULN4_UNCSA|nr:[FeFe] hydrogenase H-cluster radical SAM maturase HydG [Candidatus Saganbacteria bacterium]
MLNEKEIQRCLKNPAREPVEEIVDRALGLKGLSLPETAKLLLTDNEKEIKKISRAASTVKERIYGKRLVLFAPLYTTNECSNNCLYCGFRRGNKELKRKTLSLDEIRGEVKILEAQGHKRILLVAGEEPKQAGIARLEEIIKVIYATKTGRGEIRRVNVNVAPMSMEHFRRLKKTGIGTYQLFQETYHRETYARCHPSGPKSDYEYRLTAMDRAIQAGIDDVGIGVLFGLYDYKFEALALLSHARRLEAAYNAGPHTISVPRLEPALGAPLANKPPAPVSDRDFKKLVAVLRLAVPYTGIILSTRETAEMRNELFRLGVSQISAGSRTDPGGYAREKPKASQFELYDNRSTAQVIENILRLGYIPSFCTACYRRGRTGENFMGLAKPGEIHNFCLPNALLTFKEYLQDYGDEKLLRSGEEVIRKQLNEIADQPVRAAVLEKLLEIEAGKRDLSF